MAFVVPNHTRSRVVAIAGLIALLVVALIAGPLSQSASATSTSVSNEAEWRAAIIALSADSGGPHTITITSSFTMSDPIVVGSPNYSGDENLTINGGDFAIDTSGINVFAFLSITGAPATVTINNLTLTGFSSISAIGASAFAGDLYVNESTLTLNSAVSTVNGGAIISGGDVYVDESTFKDNTAADGGAIYTTGHVYATDSTFDDNVASNDGGAVFATSPAEASTFTDTDFTGNTASEDGGAVYSATEGVWVHGGVWDSNESLNSDGGAIYSDTDDIPVYIEDATFTNNVADSDGGAVSSEGNVESHDSIFEDNYASDEGGALEAFYHIYVYGSDFDGNEALGNGGALWSDNTIYIYDESRFEANVSGDDGGAAYAENDIYIENSTFEANFATSDGGAASADDEIETHNSRFTDNEVDGTGGALESDSIYTYDSVFEGNEADVLDPDAEGGALWSFYEIEVYDSTFEDNGAGGDGGAIFAEDSYVETYRSTFNDNQSEFDGGAVFVENDYFTAYSSTFEGNIAGGEGGGAWAYFYADSVESTWDGNSATRGGAVFTAGDFDDSYYRQSTFVNNSATAEGGAVYAEYDHLLTYFSTFVDNTAGSDGDHIYVDDDFLEVYATVFDGATDGQGCYADSDVDSLDYNFDDEGSCTDDWEGTGDYGDGLAPGLGALADNGGPTETIMPVTGSALINAIPWAACDPDDDERDQRGLNREDEGADVEGCDIGSVEVYTNVTFVLDGTTVTVINSGCSADEAVYAAGAAATAPPAGVSMPHGVFEYTLCAPWGADVPVTIVMDLPSPVTALWKLTGSTWTQVSGVTIGGTTVTYEVYDGGSLDEDGTVNGMIVDPVGPALGAAFTG